MHFRIRSRAQAVILTQLLLRLAAIQTTSGRTEPLTRQCFGCVMIRYTVRSIQSTPCFLWYSVRPETSVDFRSTRKEREIPFQLVTWLIRCTFYIHLPLGQIKLCLTEQYESSVLFQRHLFTSSPQSTPHGVDIPVSSGTESRDKKRAQPVKLWQEVLDS